MDDLKFLVNRYNNTIQSNKPWEQKNAEIGIYARLADNIHKTFRMTNPEYKNMPDYEILTSVLAHLEKAKKSELAYSINLNNISQ